MNKELLKLLACPFCSSDLIVNKDLICGKCKIVYRIEDDILNFVGK